MLDWSKKRVWTKGHKITRQVPLWLSGMQFSFLLSFFNEVDIFKLGFTEWTGGHADTDVYFSINQIFHTEQQKITIAPHLLTTLFA